MQIKTTARYHLSLVRMAIIKKSTNNKFQRACGEKGTIIHCWWKVNWCSLWKPIWRFLEKLKIGLPYDPAIPLLGIYLEKNENSNSKRYIHRHVHSTFYNSPDMETTQVPINRVGLRRCGIYTYTYICTHIQWNITQP